MFVGVWPPAVVVDQLEGIGGRLRGEKVARNLRWAGRESLHVTLRFLGQVADEEVPGLIAALDAAPLVVAKATLGPAVRRLGRQVLCVPVGGLDTLAAGVVAATRDVGQPPEDRPFFGHVTLARPKGRRGGVVHGALAGEPVAMRWTVGDIRLVRSHLGGAGARYEDLHIRPLGP